MRCARHEPAVGEHARQIQQERRRLCQLSRFRAGAAAGCDVDREGQSDEPPVDLSGTGPRIEAERELLQRELRIDARRRADSRRRGRSEERHLQPAVFLNLESVRRRQRLSDREAAFFHRGSRRRATRPASHSGRDRRQGLATPAGKPAG